LGKVAIFQTENHAGLPIENQNKPDQELSGYQFCPAFQYLPLQGGSSKKVNLSVDLFIMLLGDCVKPSPTGFYRILHFGGDSKKDDNASCRPFFV
jgi:hypothetical protein